MFVLYAGHRYGWGETTVGLTLAFVGVCTAVVQGLLIGPIIRRIGARRAVVGSLLAGTTGMSIYGLAATGPWFWAGVPVMALWGVAGPALQDMMTRHVGGSEQGQLQGATSASRSVAGLIVPGIFAVLIAGTIDTVPGAAFLLASGLLAAAALTTWFVTARTRPAARVP